LQANTTRHKTVLSNIYIAIQIVKDDRYPIENEELRMIFEKISEFTKKINDVD